MPNRTKLLLSALITAVTLLAAITTAHARRFEVSNQRFRAVWTAAEPVLFTHAVGNIRCQLTLEGSFHSRTISKVSGQLIGYITVATVKRPCTGGEGWTLNGIERPENTLPWHIRYDRFIGTLPNIERIRLQLVGDSFLVAVSGVGCVYSGVANRPVAGFVEREARGTVTGLRADPIASVPLTVRLEGFVNCPGEGSFEGGAASVTQLGSDTTRLIVHLVQ